MENKDTGTVGTSSHHNNVGLVGHYQFENGSSQFVFLDVENGKSAFLDPSHSFFTENFVQIVASSNGLILLFGYNENQPCYYVLNPLTKQILMIPQPCVQGCIVRVGLAFDGSQFEVVLIEAGIGSSNSYGLEFHIFSSVTSKWRKHQPMDLTLPSLAENEFHELRILPLYSNGAIHWEICGHLLVYQVQGSNCEIFELPNAFDDWSWQLTMTYRRILCESGGRVYYCYTDLDGFHIWQLLNENDDHLGLNFPSYDSKRLRWKLVQSVMHQVFVSKHQNVFGYFDWEPYMIVPIAYSEQAETMYLQLPGTVVSYNFDTGNLRSICTYSYPGMNFNCCSFLASNAFVSHNSQREEDLKSNGETELNLPIAEFEKLTL